MLLLQTRYFYANYSLKLEETHGSFIYKGETGFPLFKYA